MKKILWLASWYPCKVDPYTGDFIERHARSASLENQIDVLHVVKDKAAVFAGNMATERRQYKEGGEATVIYYRSPDYRISWITKIHSNLLYLKHHRNYLREYIRKNGKPDGIHVHIGLKSGVAALYLKFIFQIQYIVSEQWSGLCPEASPNFSMKPFLFRFLWKTVMKNAAGYSAVSEYLASAMQKRFSLKKISIIPNVVDTTLFYPSEKKSRNAHFIHISTLKYQKNPEQILQAAAIVLKKIPEFRLMIFGEPSESLVNLAASLQIENAVDFKGICPQEILRENIQQSTALILYSRFETFGCVIIEANATGKPVIVSDIPVFHENVQDGITGIFVPLNSPGALADAMCAIVEDKYCFEQAVIHNWAKNQYSFEKVGKQFANLYEEKFA